MPTTDLPFEESIETRIYRAIESRLRTDPKLKSVVKQWRTFQGNNDDDTGPTQETLPWIRLIDAAAPVGIETQIRSTLNWALRIETAVAGLNRDNPANLWGYIRHCMLTGDGSMQALLQKNGGYYATVTNEGLGPDTLPDGTKIYRAAGVFLFKLLIPTRQ